MSNGVSNFFLNKIKTFCFQFQFCLNWELSDCGQLLRTVLEMTNTLQLMDTVLLAENGNYPNLEIEVCLRAI